MTMKICLGRDRVGRRDSGEWGIEGLGHWGIGKKWRNTRGLSPDI